MTETDFKRLLELFPYLSFEKDNYGQLILYTGIMEDDDGTTRQMTEEDYENG